MHFNLHLTDPKTRRSLRTFDNKSAIVYLIEPPFIFIFVYYCCTEYLFTQGECLHRHKQSKKLCLWIIMNTHIFKCIINNAQTAAEKKTLAEIITGNYRNLLAPGNCTWQREREQEESVIINYLLSCNCKSLAIAAAFYERLKRLPASARLISMDPLACSAIVLSQS